MEDGGAPSTDAATCVAPGPSVAFVPTGIRVENCYVFKSLLQEYAQKAGLPNPEYHTIKEGRSHKPVFKSTVLVNNTTYHSLPGFFTRKAAEQSAAEVAFKEIMSASAAQNTTIPAVKETGLCKNLLQEYAQKMNYAIPSYICTQQDSGLFICTVEIGGIQYIGAAATTKKDSEIKAARTALLAIQGQSEGCANGAKKYIVVPGKRPVKETDKKLVETSEPLKVERRRSKRLLNNKKYMGMIDAQEEIRKLLEYDHLAAATVQLNKEAIMMQPGEGDRIVQPESPRDHAKVQHNNETRSVEQDLLSNAEVVMPNNVAITIEHEPVSADVALQSNGDSTDVKEAPSRRKKKRRRHQAITLMQDEESKTTMQEAPHTGERVQHNNEARSVEPDLLSNTEVVMPNNEAVTIEHEPVSAYVALQSNRDSTDVKEAPSKRKKKRRKHQAIPLMQDKESKTTMEEAPHAGERVQHNNEARSVEQDLLSNAEVVMPNNEAVTIEHEPVSADVALQSNVDSTAVKEAPSKRKKKRRRHQAIPLMQDEE